MADRNKIMILPFGEWKGHPMGEESYGREEAEQIVSYFNLVKERSGGKPVVIDYEHQSLNPNLAGLVPAAGWMYSLEIGEDGVYAEVEWTAKAKQAIKDKNVANIKRGMEALTKASHKLAEAVYQQAQQQQASGDGTGPQGEAGGDENVEEGDYEVIDEEQ